MSISSRRGPGSRHQQPCAWRRTGRCSGVPTRPAFRKRRTCRSSLVPTRIVIWKTALPPGHSSPVISGNRIYPDGGAMPRSCTYFASSARPARFCGDGKCRGRASRNCTNRTVPPRPSVATDGRNVFAFFTDFGLVSYGPDGEERWRVPLGPFNNPFGMGASPVLANGKVIQVCDSETGSFRHRGGPEGRASWSGARSGPK